ncbi:MAG: rhodanese [Pseudomonadota bacterium]
MYRMRLAVTVALLLPVSAAGQATEALFDPVQGYRVAHYRGVVGPAPEGVVRIDGKRAARLWRRRAAIFIDVNPAPGAVRDAGTGKWTLAEPHRSIPGAHWFPEAGRGVLAPGIERWFLAGTHRLRRAHPRRPIILFCLADCWMSWNAALRLERAGHTEILWYADGLDGWREQGLSLSAITPSRR